MSRQEQSAIYENQYAERQRRISEIDNYVQEKFYRRIYDAVTAAEQDDRQLASIAKGNTFRLADDIRGHIDDELSQALRYRNDILFKNGLKSHIYDEEAADAIQRALLECVEPALQHGMLRSFEMRAQTHRFTEESIGNIERFPVENEDLLYDSVQIWLARTNKLCHSPKLFEDMNQYANVFWRLGIQRDGDQMRQDLYDLKIKGMYHFRKNAKSDRAIDHIDSIFTFAHQAPGALEDFRGAKKFDKSVIHERVAPLHDIRPSRGHMSTEKVVAAAGLTAIALGAIAPSVAYAANNPLNIPNIGNKPNLSLPPNFEIKGDSATAKIVLDAVQDADALLDVPSGVLTSDTVSAQAANTQALDTKIDAFEIPVDAIGSDTTLENDLSKVKRVRSTNLQDMAAKLKAVADAVGPERAAKEIAKKSRIVSPSLNEKNPTLTSQLRKDGQKYQEMLSSISSGQVERSLGDIILARYYAALDNPSSLADMSDEEYSMLMKANGANFAPLMEARQKTVIERYNNVEYDKWKGLTVEGRQKVSAMMAYMELAGTPQEEIQRRLDEISAKKAQKIADANAEQRARQNAQHTVSVEPSAKEAAEDVRKVYEKAIRARVHDLVGQVKSLPGSMYSPVDADWLTDEILMADKTYAHDPLITPEFVIAQLFQESKFDPDIGSPAGARGIAQFMEGTAAGYGLTDRTDPSASIKAYYTMMNQLVTQAKSKYPNQDPLVIALASYNAGPGAVAQYGGVPNYQETQNYVDNIGKIADKTHRWVKDAKDQFKERQKAARETAKDAERAQRAAEQVRDKVPKHRNGSNERPNNPIECAPGTISVGFVDTPRTDGKKEICAILSLPSSSEESQPGSSYYVEGSNGNGIIQAKFSQNLVDMVKAAKADGIDLSLSSSYRTNKHQTELWNANPNPIAVAYPAGMKKPDGTIAQGSNHEAALALDINTGTPITIANCKYIGNRCVQPGDKVWRWLEDNARQFNFYPYSNEWWHWGPNEAH